MDALRNLANNIPDWQRRLDDLNGQIEHRQAELAAMAGSAVRSAAAAPPPPGPPPPPPLRNKGSSESLKPKDDGQMHPDLDPLLPWPQNLQHRDNRAKRPAPPRTPSTSSKEVRHAFTPNSPADDDRAAPALHHHHVCRAGASQNRAPAPASAQAKKKRRPNTVVSAEGAAPTCRTRSMIIVYYDSYVQGFFDDLVRFVSSSRNLMRKAKMAAKVAHIKRMAELEIANEAKRCSSERFAVDALPPMRYTSTCRLGSISHDDMSTEPRQPGDSNEPVDVYDSLDKSLEFVQSTCEHSAHQFLRDADCHDEIQKIQARLVEVLQESKDEIERVQRQGPELVRESGNLGKARMHRPIGMRRDVTAEHKDGTMAETTGKLLILDTEPIPTPAPGPSTMLEIDPNPDEDLDELIPTLHYRSTRLMRSGAV
ncbi:hypothetical protein E4U43_007836 [Claviceps pusilla]|uniref:Uncharacterized protein n=1 Tax=Claviceps pusilla TaxID=123648 RepID=A0A9P7T083_9HYPO|nr:hypothetical protein E4U43_007836 [Claviceps pusilla]